MSPKEQLKLNLELNIEAAKLALDEAEDDEDGINDLLDLILRSQKLLKELNKEN